MGKGLAGFEVGGGGGQEKIGFKGWIKRKKILAFRGGSLNMPSNFPVTAFVIMQTAFQNAKNQRF